MQNPTDSSTLPKTYRRIIVLFSTLTPLFLLVFTAVYFLSHPGEAGAINPDGNLSITINAAYNLVVDSNVSSPSTYAPSVATVSANFCNDVGVDMTDVYGYIGNYINGTNDTPGIYPARTGISGEHPALNNPGSYSFTHVGGAIGTADATRYIGTIPAGECRTQYWHFTYPQCENNASGDPTYPPCVTDPTWGDSVKPEDDLWLNFDVWATADEGGALLNPETTFTMTMRNEISAMANKIQPNPLGQWFTTDAATVRPGEVITSNGILYELGNINQGFDNNSDFVPDYNAWLQPVGDPNYDPSCFRLIRTSGTLTVSRSGGNPDMYIDFTDQLYFTDLPSDNTGVIGVVRYAFLALNGPCTTALTPYQEVASGFDNEKFNGDYGTGIPPLGSNEAFVTIDKTSNPTSMAAGASIVYNIPFQNTDGAVSAPAQTLSTGAMPLVISDTVPNGVQFTSAGYNAGSSGTTVNIIYSTDGGATWSNTAPTAGTVSNGDIVVQWWLEQQLGPGETATAVLTTFVPATYDVAANGPIIENCSDGRFGNAAPFAEACATTLIEGSNSIGDFVWYDANRDGVQDAGETGINNITVWLYYDDGDGILEDTDLLIDTVTTTLNVVNGYYEFTNLPDGNYIVKVDGSDPDLPAGYNHTTPKTIAVANLSGGVDGTLTVDTADFGFAPILDLTKTLTNGEVDGVNNDNLYEGQLANYQINVVNTAPGGNAAGKCEYFVWTDTTAPTGPDNSQWQNMSAIPGASDGVFSFTAMSDNDDVVELGGYTTGARAETITNVSYVIYVKEVVDFDDDQMDVLIEQGAATIYDSIPADPFDFSYFNQPIGTVYQATVDLGTSLGWADFDAAAANPLVVTVTGNRNGGTGGEIAMDAAGFIITTDRDCGDPSDTLNPVPVTDTFDNTKLEFVYANPPISSQGSVGNITTLSWNNVGPLVAGETQVIEVVFMPLGPATNPEVVNNAAATTGATFLDGRPANDANDDVNADLYQTYTIGDRVWYDLDNSGGPDAGTEPGIAGVVVQLYYRGNSTILYNGETYGSNDLLATTTTDGDGIYTFTGVPGDLSSSDYEVVVISGAGTVLGGLTNTYNAGTVNNLAGDVNTADFGYTGGAFVSGTIWHDANGDAAKTGEDFIAGVTVYLSDGVCTLPPDPSPTCLSTTTDENGRYQFTNIPDGNYTIVVDPPGNQVSEPNGENATQNCATCSNQYPITVSNATDPVNGDYDFGYTGADIGDTLYVDWNGDGSQAGDGSEEGIPNITVTLYNDFDGDGIVDAEDSLLETTITDPNGVYTFTDYPAGSYLILVDTGDPDFPAGYVPTGDPDGAFDNKHTFTTDGINPKLDVDFGYQPQGTASIGDFVWYDADRDGNQDADETTGIPNIEITLYEDGNGNGVYDVGIDAIISTTTTGPDGSYLFPNLPAGDYLVDVDAFDIDLPTDGNGDTYVLTSNNDPHPVTVAAGEAYVDADFGFGTGAVIGDYIWQDNDGDGVQDESEPPIANVGVRLCADTACNTVLATTTTDADGLYEFTGVPAGTYTVEVFSGVPAGFQQSGDPDETSPCTGGAACDGQSTITITAGQVDRSRDFGFQPAVVIGDYVWVDQDGDGVQDVGEIGIGGVTVTLNLEGGGTQTAVTDSDGYYTFGNIPDGAHTLTIDTGTLPTGLVPTYDKDGGDDNTTAATVAGATDLTFDFGYQYSGPYSVSGTVFHDENLSDGTVDAQSGELTYPSVPVYIWLDNGGGSYTQIAQTITDNGGGYIFTDLPNGNYVLSLNSASPALLGNSYSTNSDIYGAAAENDGTVYEYVNINNANVTDVDFGFYGANSPTAIALQDLIGRPQTNNPILILMPLLILLGMTTLTIVRRKKTGPDIR